MDNIGNSGEESVVSQTISFADKLLFLQNLYQEWHQLLQALTEIYNLDDFEELINNVNKRLMKQIEDRHKNIRNNLKTLDDSLELFDETLDEFQERVQFWIEMHAIIPENAVIYTNLAQATGHKNALETASLSLNDKKARVVQEEKDFQEIERYIQQQHKLLQQQVLVARKKLHKGLTDERILKFRKFEADKSMGDEQCVVCMEVFEVGRKLTQLDCKHEFCQECVEGWLADHNTCPVCGEVFENV